MKRKFRDDSDKENDGGGLHVRTSDRMPNVSPTNILPPSCIFCTKVSRYKKGTRTREPLRPCTDLKADEKVRATAKVKNDRKIMVIAVDELKAKHAKYHPQCYKDYTRPQKKSKEGSDDLKTDIIIKVVNDLLSSALVVFYKNFKLECVRNKLKWIRCVNGFIFLQEFKKIGREKFCTYKVS